MGEKRSKGVVGRQRERIAALEAEVERLRGILIDVRALVDTTVIVHKHGPEADVLRSIGRLARAALEPAP